MATPLQDQLTALDIRRVLLTNLSMAAIGGSQVVCLDIAKALKAAGAEVAVATLRVGEPMRSIAEEAGVALVPLTAPGSLPREVDLVIGLHWPVVGAALLHQRIAFRHLVLVSLSPYEPVEALWLLADIDVTPKSSSIRE